MVKIAKIKFIDDEVLGNFELDFCDENGVPFDTIIFAGENGCGKSTIINSIYDVFGNHKANHIELSVWDNEDTNVFEIKKNDMHSVSIRNISAEEKGIPYRDRLSLDSYGVSCIYSDVDINFNARNIDAVTSKTVDELSRSRKSTNDLPTQINQLIVDLQAMDDSLLAEQYRTAIENGQDTNDIQIQARMPRFTKAFDMMFDNLKYKGVINKNGHKSIMFEKYGHAVPITSLSSGEKQVVYRGCFLLRDINAISGALVFIDEPEISLHPRWQEKIMDFYKNIFTDINGTQTSQIFAVTHSPFIIHNERRSNDKVIVLTRSKDGQIIVQDKPEYYKCNSVEVIRDAFSVGNFEVNKKPTVYTEGKTDAKYYNKAIEVFNIDCDFAFKWIGYLDSNGQERNTGDNALDKGFDFIASNNLPYKNVFLYDCDTNKQRTTCNNAIKYRVDEFENSRGITKGVENTLILDIVDYDSFFEAKEKPTGYGKNRVEPELQKSKLCDYICDELSIEEQKKVFANLKTVIEELISIFQC